MPQLEHIVSISPKEGIDVFNLDNGAHLRSINIPAIGAPGAPVMLDEEHIILPQSDRAIMLIINTKTGQVKMRSPLSELVRPLAVSAAKDYLAAGAASGKVYLWHVPTGELVRVWDAHYKGVSALCFSDDDSFLFSGGDDGILNVWTLGTLVDAMAEDATARPAPTLEFSHHSLPITAIVCGAAVSGGGKLYTTSLDRSVKSYSLPARALLSSYSFPAAVTALALDPAERFFVAAAADGNLYKYLLLAPTQTDEGSAAVAGGNLWSALAAATATNAAGAPVASQGAGAAASLAGAAAAASASAARAAAQASGLSFAGHTREVTAVSLSYNGAVMVSASADGYVRRMPCYCFICNVQVDIVHT